jgi:cytochrome c biogenesis protein CcmG, thiol:disulfide interchange protein DsbE
MRNRAKYLIPIALVAVIAGMAVWAFASSDEGTIVGAGNPESQAVNYEAALADAPAPLAELYAQGDALLPGGRAAFERQIEELDGYPVVVNVWASWCGPCRYEFPFFQSQAAKRGTEVAFLGVDSDDADAAAETFLADFPLPYPSFSDPDREIFDDLKANFPSTFFFDREGEIAYTHVGPYRDEEQLAADLRRYAG